MKPPFCGPLIVAALSLAVASPVSAQPAIEGYADYQALSKQVEQITTGADPALVRARSLATTLGGREVWLLTIGEEPHGEHNPATGPTSRRDRKPAILILGNVDATHLFGSELAMRLARLLAEKSKSDDAVKRLVSRHAIYVIPRPSPDASEAFFHRPLALRDSNDRVTDDDRDSATDEDPFEDLNGDGWITQVRVEEPAGTLIPHPDDARVLVLADPAKREHGTYRLLSEGRDNDGDEQFNEDPPGGVAFNRNFTFKYPYFERGAGPHQVSEIETRAVADFAFDHPNIALLFSFSPDDNLMQPWKPNPAAENQRIKTAVLADDAAVLDVLAAKYRELHAGKGAPDSPSPAGSFVHWAYFHFGRWSLGARAWWIPEVPPASGSDKPSDEKPASPADPAAEATDPSDDVNREVGAKPDDAAEPGASTKAPDAATKPAETDKPKRAEDKRGAAERNALRWFEREKITGFVPWTPIEHPEFPGRMVEVGGFIPYVRDNPPADKLDELAQKHLQFLLEVAERLPRLVLEEPQIESLGAGVYRITAAVANAGQMPTMPQMGRMSGLQYPIQMQLEVPDGAKLIPAVARVRVEVLAAGARHEQTWIVQSNEVGPMTVTITTWAPAVGRDRKTVELKP